MNTQRKKWTPKLEVTPADIKFREKRKWQLALRRYVIEKKNSFEYAPYFGLDTETYRAWIELQFNDGLSWDNFATAWQFDHIVPVVYFDFNNEEDLKLCWNFINIRVEKLDLNKARGNRIDILGVKSYFQNLYNNTQYELCERMLQKLHTIEFSNIICEPHIEQFIIANTQKLQQLSTLSADDYLRINKGETLQNIILEKQLLQKFG